MKNEMMANLTPNEASVIKVLADMKERILLAISAKTYPIDGDSDFLYRYREGFIESIVEDGITNPLVFTHVDEIFQEILTNVETYRGGKRIASGLE